jgi:hypothetical protein
LSAAPLRADAGFTERYHLRVCQREPFALRSVSLPTSTEARIEKLLAEIRNICDGPHTQKSEARLKNLARQLRRILKEHVELANSALMVKRTAIAKREPHEK